MRVKGKSRFYLYVLICNYSEPDRCRLSNIELDISQYCLLFRLWPTNGLFKFYVHTVVTFAFMKYLFVGAADPCIRRNTMNRHVASEYSALKSFFAVPLLKNLHLIWCSAYSMYPVKSECYSIIVPVRHFTPRDNLDKPHIQCKQMVGIH